MSVLKGQIVKLAFETFMLEDCLSSACDPAVHFLPRDGREENSPELGEFCGNELKGPL